MSVRRLILVFVLGVWPLMALAQDRSPEALGVYEAITFAEAHSPVIGTLRAQLAAKRGERLSGFGLATPTVSYAREGMPFDGDGFNEQRWVIGQTVDFPLETYYRQRRIGTETDALQLRLDAERLKLRARVKKAYTELLYAQEIVHLREQEVDLADALIAAVQTRVEVGEAAELDHMKAALQAAEARSALEAAQRTFQSGRYTLFNVIGLDPEDQRYGITFPDTLAYFAAAVTQEEVLGRLPHQPDLLSAEQAVEAARYGLKQTRSQALPTLHLNYWPQDFGDGYDYQAFEVGVSVPVWFFLNNRGALQQARAVEQERRWEREAVFLDLKKQIEQTWHSYETSQRTIVRYNRDVQRQADELLRLTQEGYQLGQLDLLTLLDTQRTYVASQIRYYNALRDYYLDLIDLERFLQRDLVFQ